MEDELKNVWAELDEKEQYQRRTSLRLFNLPQEENETAESCREKVISLIEKENMNIPSDFVDRAHRIGKKEKGKPAQVIVKFSSFRTRTLFYRSREQLKKKHNVRVQLDLTRKRLHTLQRARELVESSDKVKFVCANINCDLMAITDDKPLYFSTIDDLDVFLSA